MGHSKHEGDDVVHVVVVGGGYGGVQAAVSLKKAGVSFTIVDPKEYFHHCFAALRVAVNPGLSFRNFRKIIILRYFRGRAKGRHPTKGCIWRQLCAGQC